MSTAPAKDRLVVVGEYYVPANTALSFTSAKSVYDYFGVNSPEGKIASDFFRSNVPGAMLSFIRSGLGQRPHLIGANIRGLLGTLHDGTVFLTFDGFTYGGAVAFGGATSLGEVAAKIADAINRDRTATGTADGSSIVRRTASFIAHFHGTQVYVTSVQSGELVVGGRVFGAGVREAAPYNQIIYDHSGPKGGPGHYSTFSDIGFHNASEPMTETYGILTLGPQVTGKVEAGEEIIGAGLPPLTTVVANLSGTTGPGSRWLINSGVNISGDNLTFIAPPLTVKALSEGDRSFFEIQPNGADGFDANPSNLSYISGTAATELGLTQASGAIDSTPGGQHPTLGRFMDEVLTWHNQYGDPIVFGSVSTTSVGREADLRAWAASHGREYVPPDAPAMSVNDLSGASASLSDHTLLAPPTPGWWGH